MLRQVQELRGIAVLAIVIFHLKPEVLPNGYLGVDIFFLNLWVCNHAKVTQ